MTPQPGRVILGALVVGGMAVVNGCAQPVSVGEAAGDEASAVVTSAAAAPGMDGSLVPIGYDGRYRTSTTAVLESPDHGPQLCFILAMSYPPQCGGPDIAGWDWSLVEAESAGGTTWGSYTLVGTFDGSTFTLTEPAAAPDETVPPTASEHDFTAPCPEPPGGWQPVDSERATEAALEAASATAQASPGFGGLWIDQQRAGNELGDNDPQQLVLVVKTTGDVAALEEALREDWGGSLCVTTASRTEAELRAIQYELADAPGVYSTGVDIVAGRVTLGVYVATEKRQRELDEEYGKGVVQQQRELEPID